MDATSGEMCAAAIYSSASKLPISLPPRLVGKKKTVVLTTGRAYGRYRHKKTIAAVSAAIIKTYKKFNENKNGILRITELSASVLFCGKRKTQKNQTGNKKRKTAVGFGTRSPVPRG